MECYSRSKSITSITDKHSNGSLKSTWKRLCRQGKAFNYKQKWWYIFCSCFISLNVSLFPSVSLTVTTVYLYWLFTRSSISSEFDSIDFLPFFIFPTSPTFLFLKSCMFFQLTLRLTIAFQRHQNWWYVTLELLTAVKYIAL